jgi:16S rRNA (uracil1498-N3)-methyltransferase
VNVALRHSAAHVFVGSLDAPLLDADDDHHLRRVLRLRPGQTVSIADGTGRWRLATVTAGGVETAGPVVSGPLPTVSVVSAIPKGDRVEWMVQKLTEVGARAITLCHFERSVVHWHPERAERNLLRLARIAREAAMQSRRLDIPEVTVASSLHSLTISEHWVLAEPSDGSGAGQQAVAGVAATLVIGPEGGFVDSERVAIPRRLDLGSTVLRTETAAVVGVALLSRPEPSLVDDHSV